MEKQYIILLRTFPL